MWPNTSETQELLVGAGQGQAAAVNELLDRHREALRNMIQARLDQKLARRVDASDVVQDVLLEASQRLADYIRDPKLPFGSFFRTHPYADDRCDAIMKQYDELQQKDPRDTLYRGKKNLAQRITKSQQEFPE